MESHTCGQRLGNDALAFLHELWGEPVKVLLAIVESRKIGIFLGGKKTYRAFFHHHVSPSQKPG
jgi:hypothetical protein